jgi:hypothetical protein
MQSIVPTQSTISITDQAKLPVQTPIVFPDTLIASARNKIHENTLKYKYLFNLSSRSLVAMVKKKNTVTRNVPDPFFGFIVRKVNTGGVVSSVAYVYESNLMQTIRKFIYNFPKDTPTLTHANRHHYLILKAYLNYSNKYLFINMFPSAQDDYAVIKSTIDLAVKYTTELLRAVEPTKPADNAPSAKKIAYRIFTTINDNGLLTNVPDANSFDVIYDMVSDKNNLNMLFELMYSVNA